jgi:hypothetical protein
MSPKTWTVTRITDHAAASPSRTVAKDELHAVVAEAMYGRTFGQAVRAANSRAHGRRDGA